MGYSVTWSVYDTTGKLTTGLVGNHDAFASWATDAAAIGAVPAFLTNYFSSLKMTVNSGTARLLKGSSGGSSLPVLANYYTGGYGEWVCSASGGATTVSSKLPIIIIGVGVLAYLLFRSK